MYTVIYFLGHLMANLDWFYALGCLFYLTGIAKNVRDIWK